MPSQSLSSRLSAATKASGLAQQMPRAARGVGRRSRTERGERREALMPLLLLLVNEVPPHIPQILIKGNQVGLREHRDGA